MRNCAVNHLAPISRRSVGIYTIENFVKIDAEYFVKAWKLDGFSAISTFAFQLTMEGLWSNVTHPKDFPFSVWLTHFSDLIGASHVPTFSFWGKDHIATDGFRQLAEWGSASGVESELRAQTGNKLKTLIKAAGLWYPNVNTNTTSSFK